MWTLESTPRLRKTLQDWDFGKARITTAHDPWTMRLASMSSVTYVPKCRLMRSRVERSHSASSCEAWSSRKVVRLPLLAVGGDGGRRITAMLPDLIMGHHQFGRCGWFCDAMSSMNDRCVDSELDSQAGQKTRSVTGLPKAWLVAG